MAVEHNSSVLQFVRAIFADGVAAELSDQELLERCTSRADWDASSERAFATLVARHGPMVLRVCRAAIGDEHDAQDAFQAVFLVLMHKARSLWVRDTLGPWLHAVALRVSAHARAKVSRRRIHERRYAARASGCVVDHALLGDESIATLHEELGRLPEGFRKALVLCDLEGLTHEEAAARLGWPVGTVKSRQARGRDRLRARLVRRGIAPISGGVVTMLATVEGRAAVPQSLVASTTNMAALVAKGSALAGMTSATTIVLTTRVLRAMFLTRLRMAAVAGLLLCGVVTTTGFAIHASALGENPRVPGFGSGGGQKERVKTKPSPPPLDALQAADIPDEKRPLDLPKDAVAVLGDVRGRHAGEVRCLALSGDGKILATGADQDTKVRLWDAQTLRPVAALAGHRSFVNCVAISSDGRWLASGSAYGDFLMWDLRTTPPKGPTSVATHGAENSFNNLIHAVAFSHDGKRLAVAGSGKSVAGFDTSGSTVVERGVLPGIDQEVRSLTFSHDGTMLALAGLDDQSVRLWDLGGNQPREKATLMAQRGVSGAFSPDGKTLAILNQDGHVHRWDVSRPQPIDQGVLSGRGMMLGGARLRIKDQAMVVFAPDGKALASTMFDGRVQLWDMKANPPSVRAILLPDGGTLVGRQSPGTGPLAFSPDGQTLFSGGADHLVRAWNVTAAEPQENLKPDGPIGGLAAVAFSPDGRRLAVSDSAFVRIWNLTDKDELAQCASPRLKIATSVQAVSFSPDGHSLVCGDSIWDITGNEPVKRNSISIPRGGEVRSLGFAPDGQTLASGGDDHKVRIWDMRGGQPKEWLAIDGNDQAHSVATISRSAQLACSGPKNSIRLWVLAGLEPHERALLDGVGPAWSLAFSRDGKTLAAGSAGGTQLWDVSGAKPRVLHPTKNFFGFSTARPINECAGISLAFTSDGTKLIAADHIADKAGQKPSRPAVCVYDVATGKRLHEWDLSAPCWAIALAPDDRHVAAAQQDGITVIFRIPSPPAR
jgi:RNA polymerase sigma factor (sigma-70 family)